MRAKLTILTVIVLVSALVTSCAAPTPAAAPTQAPATQAPPTQAPSTQAPATSAPAATKPPAAQAPAYIEVGASIPLTGKFGSLGTQVKPGYADAVKDINDAGGVYVKEFDKKIPLRLTIYDDESDPTKAVSKLETLFSDQKVVAYLGGAGSDMHVATTAIAEKNKVPYLGIAFALNAIHQKGYKYLFSPFPKSVQQGPDTFAILNALIPEGQRPLKVAIFQEKSDWGIEQGGLWKENAAKNGYTVVDYEEYAVGTTDFAAMISKAKAAGAETLLALPNQPSGEALFKQMVELGWTPKFSLIIRAPENVTWGKNLGKNGDYVAIFPGWHNAMKFPGVDKLNAAYQAEFNRPADLLTGPAYACVQILAAAIEKAGTLDRDKIRDAIAATNMTTVIGPVTFNPDGTGKVLNPMVQWQNGKLELVWPADQATAKLAYPAPPFDQRAAPTTAPAATLKGKKVCYLIPDAGNSFLSALTQAVKAKFAADGVEVLISGAEGDATKQFNQIENCISQKVNAMIVMAAIDPAGVEASVKQAKAAGIKVMGVPVAEQGPYDAIMHTDQYDIGVKMAKMGCDFINKTYPTAADKSVEVAIMSTENAPELKKRTNGMRTIEASCPKAKMVKYVDVPNATISNGLSAAENILTANPNVKVFLVIGDSGAQGAAQAIAAYAPKELDKYAVFSGDVSPENRAVIEGCKTAYRGAVAIGGGPEELATSTYNIVKGMLQGSNFPKETLDPLVTITCK